MKHTSLFRPLGILACIAFLMGTASSVLAAGNFSVGDKISVTDTTNVRSASSTSGVVYERQYSGATGIIKEASTKAVDGYWWYKIDYASGPDGWSIQNYLKPYTAPAANDTIKPTTPENLTITATSSSKINLSWTASTDNIGVAGYKIYRDNVQVGTSAGIAYSDTTVVPSHSYSYYVTAYDAAGNASAKSNTVGQSTGVVTGAAFTTGDHILATDTVNVRTSPSIYGAVVEKRYAGNPGTIVSGPVVADGYKWWQINFSGKTDGWAVEPYLKINSAYGLPVDKVAPTVPADLTDMVVTGGVQLDWTASTDVGNGIAGYKIYRSGILIATTVGTAVTYTDTTVIPQHTYSYQVAAYDGSGNTSARSAISRGRAGAVVDAVFNRSDRVSTTEVVNVRSGAGVYKPVRNKQLIGINGIILSGPITADGYKWWEVNFDSGADGWVTEKYLKKI